MNFHQPWIRSYMSWSYRPAWPSKIWLVFHVAITTDKMHNPSPHCAHIHCLVSINFQWMSLGAIFPAWRNSLSSVQSGIQFASYALPCQMPFCQTAPLLSSVAWKQDGVLVGRSDCKAPISVSEVVGQHNKIGGIIFRVVLRIGIANDVWFCFTIPKAEY